MSFGTELYLSTNKHDITKEEEAIIQVIQNICFIKPGTYPNDPELGLGIEDEQFELGDSAYINDLSNRLEMMIEKYVPTNDYTIETRISLKNIDFLTSQKCLIIEVFVGKDNNISKVDLLFTRMKATNKLKFNILK